ncbi:MAG: hypothetical protein ACI32F_07340 [Allobaculum sp.]
MREFRLRLMDEANQDLIELDLFDAKQVQPISKVIQLPDQKIFANSSYIGQLLSPITSDISSIDFSSMAMRSITPIMAIPAASTFTTLTTTAVSLPTPSGWQRSS